MGKASGGLMTVVTGKVAGAVGYRLQNSKAPQGWREYRGEISNPKTKGQRVQRARFASVVQAAAFLSQIIDHSFEGVTGATANRGRFIKENLAVIKPLNRDFLLKGEHRVAHVPFLLSNGTIPSISYTFKANYGLELSMNIGAIATATPAEIFPDYAAGTQFTLVGLRCPTEDVEMSWVDNKNLFKYTKTFVDLARVTFNPDASVPAFVVDGANANTYKVNPLAVNEELSLNWSSIRIFIDSNKTYAMIGSLTNQTSYYGYAMIASQKTGASYKYSRQYLAMVPSEGEDGNYGNTLEQAQETYDVGGAGDVYASAKYLNNADNV